jgi:peptidoglycan/LPS O-acetylase OafA/YrhL
VFNIKDYPVLNKGDEAVSFFFTLSGFLITYLLLRERNDFGQISIRKFYARRILRIWPLYFLIVFIGLFAAFILLPIFDIQQNVEFSSTSALLFYILFLPNLFNSLYKVGAILNPIWSIGVEEQFYLIWAPVLKFARRRILHVLLFVFVFFLAFRFFFSFNPFGFKLSVINFIYTLRFYYMAIGGIGAYFLLKHPNFTGWKVFSSKASQLIHIIVLISYFCLYQVDLFPSVHFIFFDILLSYLFAWTILNFSCNEYRIFKIEFKVTEWLGKISYGIYMYHTLIITGFIVLYKGLNLEISNRLQLLAIALLIIILTISISALSYSFFERKFLNLKDRFSP